LIFGPIADERELELLSLKGLDEQDDPEDEQRKFQHRPEQDSGNGNVERKARNHGDNGEGQRLEAVESDEAIVAVRVDEQEDDGGNHEVGERPGNVIRYGRSAWGRWVGADPVSATGTECG
jgi:hypothetical protein